MSLQAALGVGTGPQGREVGPKLGLAGSLSYSPRAQRICVISTREHYATRRMAAPWGAGCWLGWG